MISVIILTYNEKPNIRTCLGSIADLTDDIIIVDSFSTDETLDICKEFGCRIFQNPFINQAHQFNWALDQVVIKYDWVLRLDADEIVPDKLKAEMRSTVGKEAGVNGYHLNRRMIWMNRWLKHGRMYPHYILRLFRKGCGHYELKTEEHLIVSGSTAYMKNDFLEDNRNNTLDYFTLKHIKTAIGELEELLRPVPLDVYVAPSLFGKKINRTRWLKERLYSCAPLFVRPFLYFFYRYIICLGFLDGKPGLIWHVLQAFWYRFYIDAKVYEERSGWEKVQNNYKDI
ncbi:MAG: glycosyltransferase family 2 protein [Sulfuricella sp.]|nr:glycosyltransferase family 2 protein [Sulfuricella sp.]